MSISLKDRFQFSRFREGMNCLNRNKRVLSDYDREFYQKLRDGYDMVGREMEITVKQMNHLSMTAFEIDAGTYDGR